MPPFKPSPAQAPVSPENNEINNQNFDTLKTVTGGRIDISSFLKKPSLLTDEETEYLDTLPEKSNADAFGNNSDYVLLESQAKGRDALRLAQMLADLTYNEQEGLGGQQESEDRRVSDDPEKFEKELEFADKSFNDLVDFFAALPYERRGSHFEMKVLLESLTTVYLDRVPSDPVGSEEDPGVKKLKRLVSVLYPEEIKNPHGDLEKKIEEFRRNYFVMKEADMEKVEGVIAMIGDLTQIQKQYLLKRVSDSLGASRDLV